MHWKALCNFFSIDGPNDDDDDDSDDSKDFKPEFRKMKTASGAQVIYLHTLKKQKNFL